MTEDANVLEPSVRCGSCLKSEMELPAGATLKLCKDCRMALYCGKECQRLAWPAHKSFCEQHVVNRSLANINLKEQPKHGPYDFDISDEEYRKKRRYPPIHYSKTCKSCSRKQKQLPPGMTLKNCQSCRPVQYCGHECQKRHWPRHKSSCQTNSLARARQQEIDHPEMLDHLMKFAESFKCEVAEAGVYCLNLRANPDAWKTHIFEVELRYLPWREKPAHRFDVREYLNKTSCSPMLRVVMRAASYNGKKKGVCFLKEYDIDPRLGPMESQLGKKIIGSIKFVQAGAPKLRVPAEKLDPGYKKKPKA